MRSSSASTARMVIAMLSPVSPSATGKTFRSLTSRRRRSSSAHAVATARRNRTMLGSGTLQTYTAARKRFGPGPDAGLRWSPCAPSTLAPRRSPWPCCDASPRATTGRSWSSPGPTARAAAGGRSRRRRRAAADAARELGIELLQPASVNSDEARTAIAAVDPDAVLICAFGALIKEPLLSEWPMLNVHPSLLPRWRGAAPVERAIEAGDALTGVSIMRPTAEMDAGPVCLQGEERIQRDDDYGSPAPRLAALGGELLVEALDRHPPFVEQPARGAASAAE